MNACERRRFRGLFARLVAVRVITVLVAALAATSAAAATNTQIENAKTGTTAWAITNRAYPTATIEGYASLTSVRRGGVIDFFVNTTAPTFTLEIFRIGYYGGTGGRRMMPALTLPGRQQAPCPMDATTGAVACAWVSSYSLAVPNSPDPTDWMSGVYVVKLTESATGKQQYIIFVVRDDGRYSDLLMPLGVNTYQAYNPWGGKSLYGDLLHRGDHTYAAVKVSFDRPYSNEQSDGAGHFFTWEADMVRWLEREGYDVTYATNVDMEDQAIFLNHKAYLCVGHDEYWTKAMRDNVEAARDRGINLGFFCANTSYWQVRYEPGVLSGLPARTLVGYKDDYRLDPITPDYLKTNYWRAAPVNRPEDSMLGVMFVTQGKPAMVVEDASHWIFTGTGLKNGDRVTNPDGSPFMGYEVDAMGPGSPANTRRLTHSPVNARAANYADMTIYEAPSGATVFASGTIQWSYTIPQVVQMTRNILARFITRSFADSEPIRPALPLPLTAVDIGDVGRPGFVAEAAGGRFTLNGAGRKGFMGSGDDAFYYVYQPLAGDGQIVARLVSHQLYWDNRAGVMIREGLQASARFVALVGRPSESAGTIAEGAELRVKSVVGGAVTKVATQDLPQPNWLKLTRQGDVFTSWLSADGVTWSVVGSASMPMSGPIYVGLAVASARRGVWATAVFDNVTITGVTSTADSVKPVVSLTSPSAGATLAGSVAVSATASDNDAVAGVQFFVDGVAIAAEDTVAPYGVTWNSTAVADGLRTVTAVARDRSGNRASSAATVTVSNSGSSALPSAWSHSDVGSVGLPGSATYNGATYTIRGAGADIWGAADAFHYAYTQLAGDVRIVALVTSTSSEAAWVKAGVMIRNSLAPGSRHALMLVSSGKGLAFQRRTVDGQLSTSTAGGLYTAPRWVRLDRRGDVITAYQSADGVSWTLVGTETISMQASVYVGLAVSSHTTAALATATFDKVSVTPIGTTDVVAPTVSITSPANGSTVSAQTTVSANASDDVGVVGVQFKVDGTALGPEDLAAPYSTVWDPLGAVPGVHTLTATARDAQGNTSTSTITVTVATSSSTGGACAAVTLSKTTFYAGNSEANWTVLVTTPTADCSWTVTRNQTWTWLNVDPSAQQVTGKGSGSFSLRVLANTTGVFRTGSITVNGTTYLVKQEF